MFQWWHQAQLNTHRTNTLTAPIKMLGVAVFHCVLTCGEKDNALCAPWEQLYKNQNRLVLSEMLIWYFSILGFYQQCEIWGLMRTFGAWTEVPLPLGWIVNEFQVLMHPRHRTTKQFCCFKVFNNLCDNLSNHFCAHDTNVSCCLSWF